MHLGTTIISCCWAAPAAVTVYSSAYYEMAKRVASSKKLPLDLEYLLEYLDVLTRVVQTTSSKDLKFKG